MSVVDKVLAEGKLGPRDRHNGRCFVDIAESVHLHYREFRFVFSPAEYRQFAAVIQEGAANMEKQIQKGWKPKSDEFCRSGKQTKAKIIGGKLHKKMPLEKPRTSAYFNDRVVVERNKSNERDRYHVHFRDFRIAFNRKSNYNQFVKTMVRASSTNVWTQPVAGNVQNVPIENIRSVYDDSLLANTLDKKWIGRETGGPNLNAPIILSSDGFVVDGHHRWKRAIRDKAVTVKAIVTNLTFEETKALRTADRLLKNHARKHKSWAIVNQFKAIVTSMLSMQPAPLPSPSKEVQDERGSDNEVLAASGSTTGEARGVVEIADENVRGSAGAP